ncbi:hypothetical protein TMatcc_001006 [Talaromyces marneffei ATCC 18224]
MDPSKASNFMPRSASWAAGPMNRSLRESLRNGARPTRSTTSSSRMNCLVNGLFGHSLVDCLFAGFVAIVGGRCVTSIDSEELALNVRLEMVNPVDGRDIWMTVFTEWSLFNRPLVELLDTNVETCVFGLGRDDTIDGRVGEASTLGKSV